MRTGVLLWIVVVLGCSGNCASAEELSGYLEKGKFKQGVEHFTARKQQGEASNEEIFSLGVLQFFDALETLAQDFYRLGLDSRFGQRVGLPFLRLPVPVNPDPEQATCEAIRETLDRFHGKVESINLHLAGLDEQDFVVPIDIATIRIDIDADGDLEENEYFHQVYTSYNRRAASLFGKDASVVIDFDVADAYWLKGYSHLLLALTDVILAHDWSQVYERAAHAVFASVDSEVGSALVQSGKGFQYAMWADLIAGVHAAHLPVTHPGRLENAHRELLRTVECSRQTWELIGQESDDSHEWIPNTEQTGITGVRITGEMIDAWMAFLDEFEAILAGEKLVSHWRIKDGRGINLRRVFLEPRPFDLIFWIQGSAVFPYLEEGECSTRETWRRITRTFQGNFIGFAVWVN